MWEHVWGTVPLIADAMQCYRKQVGCDISRQCLPEFARNEAQMNKRTIGQN